MRIILPAAILAAVSATPAAAQDRVGNFSGAHIEVIGGMDYTSITIDDEEEFVEEREFGGLYGIAGGFDIATPGGIVVGVEAELSDSTARLCDNGGCIDATRDIYVGGRAGMIVSNVAMVYVKGGYTNAQFEAELDGETENEELDGFRVGAGVEWDTGSPLRVRLEYRYSDYEQGVSRHQGVVGLGLRF